VWETARNIRRDYNLNSTQSYFSHQSHFLLKDINGFLTGTYTTRLLKLLYINSHLLAYCALSLDVHGPRLTHHVQRSMIQCPWTIDPQRSGHYTLSKHWTTNTHWQTTLCQNSVLNYTALKATLCLNSVLNYTALKAWKLSEQKLISSSADVIDELNILTTK